jgi:AbrB family looped-hinge helix DNA binding protein
MHLLKITTNGQITLPISLRKKWNCNVGDYVLLELEDNELKIKPIVLTDPTQSWFWTKEWQEGEKEASQDIKKKRLSKKFSSPKETIKSLKEGKL